MHTSICDTLLPVQKVIAYESLRTLGYEIFMRMKISAIVILFRAFTSF